MGVELRQRRQRVTGARRGARGVELRQRPPAASSGVEVLVGVEQGHERGELRGVELRQRHRERRRRPAPRRPPAAASPAGSTSPARRGGGGGRAGRVELRGGVHWQPRAGRAPRRRPPLAPAGRVVLSRCSAASTSPARVEVLGGERGHEQGEPGGVVGEARPRRGARGRRGGGRRPRWPRRGGGRRAHRGASRWWASPWASRCSSCTSSSGGGGYRPSRFRRSAARSKTGAPSPGPSPGRMAASRRPIASWATRAASRSPTDRAAPMSL